jgi:glycerophosphoryl diester phosphodiesterase
MYDEFARLQKEDLVPDNFMCSPSYDGATAFYVLQLLELDVFFGDRMSVFQLPMEEYGFDLATARMVRAANSHNMAVHYWTINDVEDMKHLIDIGADGIMTDYPHRLKEVYDTYKK